MSNQYTYTPLGGINYLIINNNPDPRYTLATNNVNGVYVPLATKNTYGVVKVGDGLVVTNGEISVDASLITQYITLPEPSEDLADTIVQYVGATTSRYINGYFYKCVNSEWINVLVQPGGSGDYTQADLDETDTSAPAYVKNKYTSKLINNGYDGIHPFVDSEDLDVVQGNVETLSDGLNQAEQDIQSLGNRVDTAETDIENLEGSVNQVADDLATETTNRTNAVNGLQNQIDAMTSRTDVVDVVGTYAQLQAYITTALGDNDIVKVLVDETRQNAISYYRWHTATSSWSYVGSQGPFYTKAEADTTFVSQTAKINNKPLSDDIQLDAEDVGALPDDTVIPTNTSDLNNDSGFITESDLPTVNNATVTFTQGGTVKGSISLNQSSNTTIDFDAGGGSSTGLTIDIGSEVYDASEQGYEDVAYFPKISVTTLQTIANNITNNITLLWRPFTNYMATFNNVVIFKTTESDYDICFWYNHKYHLTYKLHSLSTGYISPWVDIVSTEGLMYGLMVDNYWAVENGVGVLHTNTAYNPSTNKFATMADIDNVMGRANRRVEDVLFLI